MVPAAQERFSVQHFIDAIRDVDDRMRLRRDKPRTLDEALLTACELEAFCVVDTGLTSKPRIRSVENFYKETNELEHQVGELTKLIQTEQLNFCIIHLL